MSDLEKAREAADAYLNKSIVRLLLIARAEEAERCAEMEAGCRDGNIDPERLRERAAELLKAAEEMK